MVKIKKIKKSRLAKNILLVASGTLGAQIINTVITPIITRLYPAEVYGVLSVYNSAISIFVIASALAFQKSIPIIDTEYKAKIMLENCIGILTIYSLSILALCIVVGKSVFKVLGIVELYDYRIIIPIGVFIVGTYEIFLQWIYREQAYSLIPKTRLIQAIAGGVVKLTGGLLYATPMALLFGAIVNQGAGLSSFLRKIESDIFSNKVCEAMSYRIKLLTRYKSFLFFSLPADFISTFSGQIPVLMLSSLFGSAVSGYYGLANSIINIPISLVIVSISRVLYAEAAKIGKNRPKELKKLCLKITKVIFFIVIIPAIVAIGWGPQIFALIFGEEWFEAGKFARLMIGMIVSYCLVLPIGRVYEILEKQNFDFLINFFRLIAIGVAVYIIKNNNLDCYFAVGIVSTINMIAYLIMYMGVILCLEKQIRIVEKGK